MNTPTGRSEDESIEATVRPLLWRLRARLVTPPPEGRAETDLDRLLAAARQHAHEAPLAEVQDVAPEPEPIPVHHLRFEMLGRVAAAAVLFAAIGGGAVSAGSGGITIDALLGRTPLAPPSAAPILADAAPTPAPDTEAIAPPVDDEVGSDVPAPAAETEPTEQQDELMSEPVPASEAEAPGEPSVPSEPATPEIEPVAPPSGESSTTSPTRPSEPKPEPSPQPEPEPSPRPQPEPEIIAAPAPPGSTDGFGGGPRLCPDPQDASTSAPCPPVAPGPVDEVVEQNPEDALEELARRRAGDTSRG